MNWIDGLGFLASAAVPVTFYMKRMFALRVIALISNVLFAGYGYLDHLYPVLTLHLVLFPINCFRLHELRGKSSSADVQLTGRNLIVSSAFFAEPTTTHQRPAKGPWASLIGHAPITLS